jgi:hypothetical protein
LLQNSFRKKVSNRSREKFSLNFENKSHSAASQQKEEDPPR